jgi:peptidoglycan/xylan/chitin deacetylase (PgdA/CDA1 family)
VGSIVGVRTEQRIAVMTFDDGPDPVGTPAVLDTLRAHGVTATFFVLMTRVRRYSSLLDEIVEAGHEIALHGVDHTALPTLGMSAVYQRCRDGRAELEDRIGRSVQWMRPPYGRQTPWNWAAVRSAGLTPVLWGGTSWDWKDAPDDVRIRKAMSTAAAGVILLNHDAHAGAGDRAYDGPEPRIDRGPLVDGLLRAYSERGLSGCSLVDALRFGTAERAARFSR